jgi:hypothetical protein
MVRRVKPKDRPVALVAYRRLADLARLRPDQLTDLVRFLDGWLADIVATERRQLRR